MSGLTTGAGVTNVERLDVSDGQILDSRNIKHRPLNYIGAKKWLRGSEIDLNKGEVKRVFYVLEYIPPEELKTDAHTGSKDNYVRFSVKSYPGDHKAIETKQEITEPGG